MASLFVWDNKRFELKVTEMDNEHKQLIEIMNRLYAMNHEKSPKENLLAVVNELIDFVILHFRHEETYLDKIKFPNLTNHKGIHERLLSQLHQHKNDFEASSSMTMDQKFFDFLTLWLSGHIQHIDMQYSPQRYKP